MDIFDAIEGRRSIRRFSDREVPKDVVERILQAAALAPSAKNRQPWKFIVLTGERKKAMEDAMRAGFDTAKRSEGLLPDVAPYVRYAEVTLRSMEQAPVTVFIFNTEEGVLLRDASVGDKMVDMANVQSIGAAIEHMLLAATALGVGSLWICDVFFAYQELCAHLGETGTMVAAVSLGYAKENPGPRPRKPLSDVVEWR